MPLLEAQLDERPDMAAELAAASSSSSNSKKGGGLDLKHQVSLLAEGQALPLTQLAQHISALLSSGGSGAAAAAGAGAEPAAAAAAAAGGGGGGVSPTVVRNLLQEVASRKSYGLSDGGCGV